VERPGEPPRDRRTGRSVVDAERFLATVAVDLLRGEWTDPALGRCTFGDYVKLWLPSTARLADGTRANIDGRLRNHLLPYFGEMPVAAIRPAHVRGWVAGMVGKGLAPSTVKSCYWLLGDVLGSAEVDRYIARSPLAAMDPRKDLPRDTAHQEMTFLDAAQVARLAEAIDGRYRALVYTAAYTGLRFGELAALRVPRVDLLRGTLDVAESLSDVNGRLTFKGTKTGARRTVSLPRFLCETLGEHLGLYPARDDLVFSSAHGLPLRRRLFYRRSYKPAVAAAGLDGRLRFHDLRHTCAALLIAQGAHAKEIQERLGHSTIRLTFDRYGHLLPSLDGRLRDGLQTTYELAQQQARVGQAWAKEGQHAQVTPLTTPQTPPGLGFRLERTTGFEPATPTLARWCSTTEPRPRIPEASPERVAILPQRRRGRKRAAPPSRKHHQSRAGAKPDTHVRYGTRKIRLLHPRAERVRNRTPTSATAPGVRRAGGRASAPRRAEAALAAHGGVQRVDLHDRHVLNTLHDQLSDPLAALQGNRLGRIEVDDHDLDLAAIARVDDARSVDQRDAVARGQAGAGVHQPHMACGQGDGDPRRHQGPLAWAELHPLARVQVQAGVVGARVGRQGQVRVQPADRQPGTWSDRGIQRLAEHQQIADDAVFQHHPLGQGRLQRIAACQVEGL